MIYVLVNNDTGETLEVRVYDRYIVGGTLAIRYGLYQAIATQALLQRLHLVWLD